MKKLVNDENAVSVSVGYILTFAITALVIVLIMGSFFMLVEQTENRVSYDEYKVYANLISNQISEMDRFIYSIESQGGAVNSMEYEVKLPLTIAGNYYTVELCNSSEEIIFTSQTPTSTQFRTPYSINSNTEIASGIIYVSHKNHYLIYDNETKMIILE